MISTKYLRGLSVALLAITLMSCPRKAVQEETAGLRAARQASANNEAGEIVPYAVQVDKAPRKVAAFGMDIKYDPALLEYTGNWDRGDLTEEFTEVGVREISPGVLRVGGFTIGDPIAEESTGVLTTLEFTAKKSAPPQLSIVQPVDDIADFTLTAPASEKSKAQLQ